MGIVGTSKEASGEPGENLCPEEFDAKLAALSDSDKVKLSMIEDQLLRGTGMKPGELHHEVVCRVWLGKRHCPVGVPVMAFFVNAMKSIAGHERARQKERISIHAVAREGEMALPATALTPEVEAAGQFVHDQGLRSIETIGEIVEHLTGDEEAQLVALGWAAGLRGADLRDQTGLDRDTVEYAAKRIRKKMRGLYPNGWRG